MFLSTAYRLRVEAICDKISNGETVELSEIIWVEKLSKTNSVVARMLRQARRSSMNNTMEQDSLDGFLNALDLGDPDPQNHKSQFNTVDEIVDFFKRDDLDGDSNNTWRRRD
jgi:hypothetical protein